MTTCLQRTRAGNVLMINKGDEDIMLGLKQVHHIAIIATDYAASKSFYCDILGFTLLSEAYRAERDSWKGDLALNGQYVIELFHFLSRQRVLVTRKPAVCAIWRSAWMTWIMLLHIWRRITLIAKPSVLIPSPTSASPFLKTRMACRSNCMSSKACYCDDCPVTCRATSL